MQLVIGNKNYSSWSMRPWLLLRHFNLEFEEVRIALFTQGFQERLSQYSPTLKVPVLLDGDETIWDSMAICEYVSEKYLEGAALPKAIQQRATCRSYCSEMHSGFNAIRSELPMNCRARRRLALNAPLAAECRRIDELWSQAREQHAAEGEYLFGEFSIADCMYAPIVSRFATYGVELSQKSSEYLETMLNTLAFREWLAAAELESETIADGEVGEDITL